MRKFIFFLLVAGSLYDVKLTYGQIPVQWEKYVKNYPSPLRTEPIQTYLIEFQGTTAQLINSGAKILRVLDDKYYIVTGKSMAGNHLITVIKPTNHTWKLSEKLYQKYRADPFLSGKLNFVVDDVTGFTRTMKNRQMSFVVSHIYQDIIVINFLKPVSLDQLIRLPTVRSIEIIDQHPVPESPLRDFNYNVNHINRIQNLLPDLNGQDLTVSVKERQYDVSDIDFRGRHVPSTLGAPDVSNHATEMATIIAGGGNSSFQGRGIAWGARLTSSDFTSLLPDDNADYAELGVTVQNHSYGTSPENFYGTSARAYDLSANQAPELLHVFSAGNSGSITTTEGPYAGIGRFANITGNFKMAKNVLVVGGSDTLVNVLDDISQGPAFDGRIKPELVAYSLTGSSSSAAVVSGISLLLQQRYSELNGSLPPSALLRAILINTADDTGRKGIDHAAGYGNVNAFDALKAIEEGSFMQSEVAQGSTIDIPLMLPDNIKSLKVTLTWNDPASEVNSSRALVNDLDLILHHTNSGTSYHPWVLSMFPNADSLNKPPVRKPDHVNNVEQVSIENPSSGNYIIAVSGFDISSTSQQFFIAYQWDESDQFTWTFPTARDNLPQDGEFQSFFRWESTKAETTGSLEYSIDGGVSWNVIQEDIDLSRSYFSWSPPRIDTKAKARMIIGNTIYDTEEFIISRPLRASVGFNCPDSLLITWPRVDRASHYLLSTPGNMYLDQLIQTPDTALVLDKAQFPQTSFTVTPFFEDKPGLRNLTFDYRLSGVGCFVSNFLANLNPGTGADLSLTLGTTYQVEEVAFQRLGAEGFEDIATFSEPGSVELSHTDTNAGERQNVYRARIRFPDNAEIYSENDTVFFLNSTVAVVFPNPVYQSEDLIVFLKDFGENDAFFRVYDTRGQFLLEYKLARERDGIPMRKLKQGLYFYEIVSGDERQTGRIVVN